MRQRQYSPSVTYCEVHAQSRGGRQYHRQMIEHEDDDPVGEGSLHDPLAVFTRLAVKHGLIREGDKLDQNMIDFAVDVVGICADIADGYDDEHGNAGEHIRAELWA